MCRVWGHMNIIVLLLSSKHKMSALPLQMINFVSSFLIFLINFQAAPQVNLYICSFETFKTEYLPIPFHDVLVFKSSNTPKPLQTLHIMGQRQSRLTLQQDEFSPMNLSPSIHVYLSDKITLTLFATHCLKKREKVDLAL